MPWLTFALVLGWLVSPGELRAQNLLNNSSFTSDLSGWIALPYAHCQTAWNAVGQPDGGAHLSCEGEGDTAIVMIRQCVPVDADERYDFTVSSRLSLGTGAGATARAQLSVFSALGCKGSPSLAGIGDSREDADGSWRTLSSSALSPPGASSAMLALELRLQTSFPASGDVTFDNADVRLSPARGDFNGDRKSDLVLWNGGAFYEVWYMNGASRIGTATITPVNVDSSWHLKGVTDLDYDGDADLIFRHATNGSLDFWVMNGPTRLTSGPVLGMPPPTLDWELAATGDFNRDRRPDLVWRNLQTQELKIWLMNGRQHVATVAPSPDAAAHANWSVVAAVDYNGDGTTDLLWYNSTSGKIVQWLLDSDIQRIAGRFTEPSSAGDNNWKVVASADYGVANPILDVKHTNDVVWRNESSGKLVLWRLDLSGARTTGVFISPDSATPPLGWTVVGPR